MPIIFRPLHITINPSLIIIILLILIFLMLIHLIVTGYIRHKLRKKNEEIINFNELRSTFMDAFSDLVYLKDENLRYVFINKALEDFYKKPASKIIGYNDFDISSHGFAQIRRETDLKVLEKNTIITEEVRWENKIYKSTKFPVKLTNDKIGVGAYIQDITDEVKKNSEIQEKSLALKQAFDTIKENEEQLNLILNSAAEGIYGIDPDGNFTFCNKQGLNILKYKSVNDLIGKNAHNLIHHTHIDNTNYPANECTLMRAITEGESIHLENEILWRSNHTYFEAEIFANPQIKHGKIIGAVVTFNDITHRKASEREVMYLSYHDALTGLYNRRYFEAELKRLDSHNNLPISIILGDINGLKLTNDVFGHTEGDILLQSAAKAMMQVCRENDIISRWGGDEYAIILPKTSAKVASNLMKSIQNAFTKEYQGAFNCNISLGSATKTLDDENISEVVEKAEEKMYLEKTITRREQFNNSVKEIINTLHKNYPQQQRHSINVSNLCEKIGIALNLTTFEMGKLREASYLHDIGKIAYEDLLSKTKSLSPHEFEEMRQHPVVGFRILNSSEITSDIARYILHHHEKWDGSGYPKGLKGEEIPRISRIICVAENYDSLIHSSAPLTEDQALVDIQSKAGTRYDPEIVKVFVDIMQKKSL